jgi:hypothetical protein
MAKSRKVSKGRAAALNKMFKGKFGATGDTAAGDTTGVIIPRHDDHMDLRHGDYGSGNPVDQIINPSKGIGKINIKRRK